MLETIGLSRDKNIYITNTIFWRPPANRRPTPDEIETCKSFVEKHIALLNPELIILIGGTATASLLGKKEKISVPAGKFYAIETRPEMQNLRGVFKKSPDGILRVWYSADSQRIPVKISSKVIVGSFNANLRKTSGLK